jgi:hypothetical protein
LVEVHGAREFPVFIPRFSDAVGEKRGELLDVLGGEIGGVELKLFQVPGSGEDWRVP